MRAQIIEAFGETDCFRLTSLPEPTAAHGEVVVALAATSVLSEAGKLQPLIDPEPFTLEDLPRAHQKAEAGRALGKIVIDIARDPPTD